jgi:hypothetical protein
VEAVGVGQLLDAGGGVLAAAEQLAGAGVDQIRPAVRPLHEDDAGRQVIDQGAEHRRGAAEIVGQGAPLGHVGDDALPAG